MNTKIIALAACVLYISVPLYAVIEQRSTTQKFKNHTNSTIHVTAQLDNDTTKSISVPAWGIATMDLANACVLELRAEGTSRHYGKIVATFRPIRKCGSHSLHLVIYGGKLHMKRWTMEELHDGYTYRHRHHAHRLTHEPVEAAEDVVHGSVEVADDVVHGSVSAAEGIVESVLP